MQNPSDPQALVDMISAMNNFLGKKAVLNKITLVKSMGDQNNPAYISHLGGSFYTDQ
jgi:hypothetical protein